MKSTIKKEICNIFRHPERAYATMDFHGRGYITEEDFLCCIVMKRIPFSREEVKDFFKQFNLFTSKQSAADGK